MDHKPQENPEPFAMRNRGADHPSDRWVMLCLAALGLAVAYGGIGTISVLVVPLQADFGWPKADISIAYTLMSLGAAAGGLLAGRLADRFPTGPIACAGVVVIGLGMMLLSIQSSIRVIQAVYLVIGLLGFSCLYSPLLSTVSHWFGGKGGLAMGIVTAGGAVGQAVVPPVLQSLLGDFGWRDAIALFGAAYVALFAPAMLLMRKPRTTGLPASSPDAAPADRAMSGHPVLGIGLLSAAGLFCCALMGMPTVHLMSFAAGQGLEPLAAAAIVSTAMLVACAGRVVTGLVVDHIGSLQAYALVSAVQTAAVLAFAGARDEASLHLIAAIYGFGFGGVMTALVCAVRDAVPANRLGTAMAMVGLLAWIGMAAGGYQGGLCFDLTGSYDLSFAIAGASGVANLLVIGVLCLLARGVTLAPARSYPTLARARSRRVPNRRAVR